MKERCEMRTITAILAVVGLLMVAGLALGLEPAPASVIVSSEYATGYGQGHQYQHEGYTSRLSAYAAGACGAPPYGMEDTGRACNHWRNSCCDDAWAGYCNETGLFGYRTERDSCHCGTGCGGLFSLFRWSQPAGECAADDCELEYEAAALPAEEIPTPPEA